MSSDNPEPPLVIDYQGQGRLTDAALFWRSIYRGIIRYYAVIAALSIVYYACCFQMAHMRWRYFPATPIPMLEDRIVDLSQSPFIPPLLFVSGVISCTFYYQFRTGRGEGTVLLASASFHVAIVSVRVAADVYVYRTVRVPLLMQLRGSSGIGDWDAFNASWDVLVCILLSIPLLLCPLFAPTNQASIEK
jgi:hypothetical protein